MPILYRYLMNLYLGSFLNVLGVFVGLFALLDGVEQIRRFAGKAGVEWGDMLLFILLRLPEFLLQFVAPMAMLATVFTLIRLVRQNEITAMRASGLSIYRILIPFLLGGLVVAGGQMLLQDQVIPRFDPISRSLYDYLKSDGRAPLMVQNRELWLRDGPHILNAKKVLARERILRQVSIFTFNADLEMIQRVEAERMVWREDGWHLVNGTRYHFLGATQVERFTESPWQGNLEEERLGQSTLQATSYSMGELLDQIQMLRQEGYPTTTYQVTLQRRLADPATTLTAILLAFPFSLRLQRLGGSGRTQAAALAMGFALFFLVDLSTALGMGARLPPWLSAWGPTAFFFGVGAFLLMHLEEESATPRRPQAVLK